MLQIFIIIKPDIFTYSSLAEVPKLWREMVERKIMSNVHTFNILVDTLGKEGMLKEAKEVFAVMIQRGIESDTITYTSLIDGYCLQNIMDMKLSKHLIRWFERVVRLLLLAITY
jgi:pentatricopeptide repeat protein